MQTALLASSLIQSIISKHEIVRGSSGVAYGGKGKTGVLFYHVLKYSMPNCMIMETIYEGGSAMEAAETYVRNAGAIEAHGDAVRHNIEKNRRARISLIQNVR